VEDKGKAATVGVDMTVFSNPIREQRPSYRERISGALTRASNRSSNHDADKAEHLLDDHRVLCMTTSHETNHSELKWRGRGVRERARIMREE
jgi:hypothetical protein